MSTESEHQHSYSEHYEQQQQQQQQQQERPIFSHTNSTDSFHQQQQQQQEYHSTLLSQQQQQQHPSSSPHRLNTMSSQPTTPKPSSATTANNSPHLENTHSPLEQQKYNENNTSYSPHTNTIRTTAHRKESVVPNINETCPSFGPTEYNHNVISMDRQSIIDVRLHTKVDRGFFLAEEDWTCYRRNYFQVSGSFSLEGVGILYEGQEFPCLVKDPHGQLEEIHCFMLGVSARLSDCDKSIQLIQHTPKRDKGPQTTPTPKPIRPGGNIGFSAVGSSQSIVTFERLQFKTATANNGKRRAAQQYYVIIVELLAKLRNGNIVSIATTKSAALVVRGRSPGHYAETDSGVSHTITPKQHRGSTHSIQQPQHVPPFGRPTAYAGASPNLFQPTEYMPYDYHGVAYTNYGHLPHHHQQQQQQQQQQQHPSQYPNHSNSGSPSVPMMSQQQYVHDRTHSSHSNSEPTYPPSNNNNNNNTPTTTNNNNQHEYAHEVKEENHHHQPPHSSSPYYWQRSNSNADHTEQQQQQQQEHWNRMRMASNNTTGSSSVDNSQHGSPYMSHPQQQQQNGEHPYYHPQQQQQQQHYGGHSYGHHTHPPPTQSLPPPPTSGPSPAEQQQQHYPGYNNYDWQPRPKMSNTYSYESDRRHEYNERQQHQSPPPPPPPQTNSNKATIVK